MTNKKNLYGAIIFLAAIIIILGLIIFSKSPITTQSATGIQNGNRENHKNYSIAEAEKNYLLDNKTIFTCKAITSASIYEYGEKKEIQSSRADGTDVATFVINIPEEYIAFTTAATQQFDIDEMQKQIITANDGARITSVWANDRKSYWHIVVFDRMNGTAIWTKSGNSSFTGMDGQSIFFKCE